MNLRSRATGPFAPARLSQRALVIGCFSKLTPFMRPDVRIFYSRPPLCGWREGVCGKCKPRNRARVLDKPVTDTSIPPFRRDNLIEGEGKGEASFHDPVATLDNARIDDQPSQQKSWETKRLFVPRNKFDYVCVCVCVLLRRKIPLCLCTLFHVVLFILENSREKDEFLQGM